MLEEKTTSSSFSENRMPSWRERKEIWEHKTRHLSSGISIWIRAYNGWRGATTTLSHLNSSGPTSLNSGISSWKHSNSTE